MENKTPSNQDAANHLANERTLLAWIRTSIAIMAFGFVVVKFSLFVRQLSILLNKDVQAPQHGYSFGIGIAMVAAGAVVLLLSYIRYLKTKRLLEERAYQSSGGLIAWLIAIILLTSALLIFYLIETSTY